jgi:membrane protein required for colicin V production
MLALVVLSSVLGLWRGLTRELVSTVAWVIIAVAVVRFAQPLGEHLGFDAPGWLRTMAAAAIIVVVCVLASAVLGRLLSAAVSASKLAGADRILGAVFGAVRAGLFGVLVAALLAETGFSEQDFWQHSQSGPLLEKCWYAMAGSSPGAGRRALDGLIGD